MNELEDTRTMGAAGAAETVDPAGSGVPLVDVDDITPDESLVADVRRTRITTPFTRVLLALVVVGVAMLGGALLDRWQRPASSASPNLASIAARFGGGASGSSGASGASGVSGAAGGGATIGTVKLVDGTSVYVQDLQGNTVKVTTQPTTTVSVSKTGKPSDLVPGSTVIVQGKQNADGTSLAATSISQTTGFGAGGGGFGAGRGAGG
ncbi:MAG TPA: hypothetical protein VL769_05945 [Acidimicrobiia bacterium]|nr:hypothetical protein [Acidimicrobiia bacterium]